MNATDMLDESDTSQWRGAKSRLSLARWQFFFVVSFFFFCFPGGCKQPIGALPPPTNVYDPDLLNLNLKKRRPAQSLYFSSILIYFGNTFWPRRRVYWTRTLVTGSIVDLTQLELKQSSLKRHKQCCFMCVYDNEGCVITNGKFTQSSDLKWV